MQFIWKGKNLITSEVPSYPAAMLEFSIICGQDLFLQIPWNTNHNSSCRKETFLKVLYLSHGLKASLAKFVKSNGITGARWRETVSISHMDNSDNSKNAFVLLQQLSSDRHTFSSQQQHLYRRESLRRAGGEGREEGFYVAAGIA